MEEETSDQAALQALVRQHFAPAEPGAHRAKLMTTADLFAVIDEHAPGVFTPGLLWHVLRQEGYRSRLVGDSIIWSVAPR